MYSTFFPIFIWTIIEDDGGDVVSGVDFTRFIVLVVSFVRRIFYALDRASHSPYYKVRNIT